MTQKFTAEEVRARFETWVSSQPWFAATIGLTMTHDAYIDPCINSRWQGWRTAYADLLSKPAGSGRVDANCMDVLRRLRDMLPTVGICGWPAGVSALDEAISTLAAQGQGEKMPVPASVDRTHKNKSYLTLGFYDEQACTRFFKAITRGLDLYTHPAPAASPAGVPDGCIPIHRTLLDKLATDMDSIDMPKIGAAIRRWVANYDARQSAAPAAPEGGGGAE